MNRKLKIAIIILITGGVIAGAVLLFLNIKPDNDNICDKINKKYGLKGPNAYKLQKESESIERVPVCCPNVCGQCDSNIDPNQFCTWEKKKDEYQGFTNVTSLPDYECEKDLLIGDNKDLSDKVCLITGQEV